MWVNASDLKPHPGDKVTARTEEGATIQVRYRGSGVWDTFDTVTAWLVKGDYLASDCETTDQDTGNFYMVAPLPDHPITGSPDIRFIGDPQTAVAQAVAARGYRDGWTPEQFLARQFPKLIEELGEASECLTWDELHNVFQEIGEVCRLMFDDRESWEPMQPTITDKAALGDELADVLVVLFCMADIAGVDVIQAAVNKATSDIKRGVRNGKP